MLYLCNFTLEAAGLSANIFGPLHSPSCMSPAGTGGDALMFLVKLIDVFVGILEFIFKSDKRAQGASAATLGTAGIITLLAIMLVAVGVPRIVYHNSTTEYTAELANASGLTSADPVLVAGVPAGRIEQISLAGDRVNVRFRLDNGQRLGDQTTAGVRLRTVLGKRYLEVIPAGSGSVGTGGNGARM